MTDIQFEGESEFERPSAAAAPSPFFVRLLLRTGLVQTERAANYVLIGIASVGIVFTLFTLFSFNESNPRPVNNSITGVPISPSP